MTTTQWGFVVFILGAVLLALAASQLSAHRTDTSSPVPAGRPVLVALGTALMAYFSLGFWQYRASQPPPRNDERLSGMPFPHHPPHSSAPGGFPSMPMRPEAPHINGPATTNIPVIPEQFTEAMFSPDGQFLAAAYGNEWIIWALKGAQTKVKPVFRGSMPKEEVFKRTITISSKKKNWQSNTSPAEPRPYVAESAVLREGENLARGEEVLWPQSQAVVWKLWDTTEQGTKNELGHNGRIAISSLPGGQVFQLPEELRMAGEISNVTLAPCRPGERLFAAINTKLSFSSGSGGLRSRLRVFDVTMGRKLWEKKLPDGMPHFQFSPDGRFLIGAGTPRAEPTDPNATYVVGNRTVRASKMPTQYSGDGLDIWETASGRLKTRLNEKGIASDSLTVNKTQKAVLYFKHGSGTSYNHRLVARSIPEGKLLARLELSSRGMVPRLSVSPDGAQIALIEPQKIDLISWRVLESGKRGGQVLTP